MRRLTAVVCALGVMGLATACGSQAHSRTSSAPQVRASASWSAHMSVPTHHPRAGRGWRVRIVARRANGRYLAGTVIYHFLYGGQLVSTQSCRPRHPRTPCSFRGVYHDVVRWPARSIGYRLTFQATVHTRLGTKNLNYWVQVRR